MSKYQLFPALLPVVEVALRDSIKRFGVLVPILKDQDGNVLDGHHRSRIAKELGVQCPERVVHRDEKDAREIAISVNSDRRHLTEEQRRAVVASLRAEGHSERAIAGAVGVSKSTVHRDVEDLRATAPRGPVEPKHVVGQDGKRRQAQTEKTKFKVEQIQHGGKKKAKPMARIVALCRSVPPHRHGELLSKVRPIVQQILKERE